MKTRLCPALWFSGFFGLGAVIHLTRGLFGFDLPASQMPAGTNIITALVLGAVSGGLLVLSFKRVCGKKNGSEKKDSDNCCLL